MTEQQIAEALGNKLYSIAETDFGYLVVDLNKESFGQFATAAHKAPVPRLIALNPPPNDVPRYLVERDWLDVSTGEIIEQYTIARIINAVSVATGISENDIRSNRRAKVVVHARMIVVWLAKRHTKLSFPQIGRVLGNRNHSTVMHSVAKVTKFYHLFEKHVDIVAAILREGRS